jgi:threonine dehydrogenase-like Zn-dependent dehydrogenase
VSKQTRAVPAAALQDSASASARAAVVTGAGVMQLATVGVPEPATGQVRIRLEGSGVCGSNLPVWEGREWFQYPLEPGAPGHEGWGVVEAVGEGVAEVAIGDRVCALSYHAFAEVDIADAAAVVPLPPTLGGVPFPGEALGCAMNVFRRSDIRAGQTVAIIGIGFLGAVLTQLATRAGARVIAISRREYALEVARAQGAQHVSLLDDHQRIIEDVRNITDDCFCDRVVEATGLQWPLDLAGELTRERGRLIIAGFHQDGARSVNMFLWNWRGLDVINAHERAAAAYVRGMRDAVRAVVSRLIDPTPLYTHSMPLDRAAAGLDLLRTRPDGFMKAIVTA